MKFDSKVFAIHCLRVNVKSLAAEAKIIRQEEKRSDKVYCLSNHRIGRLREEARLAHLALGFVRGRKYKSIECKTSKPIDPQKLYAKINRFYTCTQKDIASWLQ